MSNRELRRRWTGAVGYGPKALQRILRRQRLLLMPRAAPLTQAAVAAACGCADQAQMVRDVRPPADSTSTALRRASQGTLGLSDLYKADVFHRT